jgi:hypothetical protein
MFIAVPDPCSVPVHSAKALAERLNDPESGGFRYEFLVEGEIPKQWVLHQVSLKTLMSRGLDEAEYFFRGDTATEGIRLQLAERMDSLSIENTSAVLGCFARYFGANAPVYWIADMLYRDCLRPEIIEDDVVALNIYSLKDERAKSRNHYVDFDFFEELYMGIDIVLGDMWLANDEFLLAQEELEEWKADEACNVWEELESLSDDPDVYQRAYGVLWSRYHREVEEQSVRIGL